MGISGLQALIKKECGYVIKKYHLSTFTGYRIAIDISIIFYKFVRSVGPTQWLDLFLQYMCTLKKYGIKMVCIFDGPNPPIEKKQEQARRRETVAKIEKKKIKAQELYKAVSQSIEKSTLDVPVLDEGLISKIKSAVFQKGHIDVTDYTDAFDVQSTLAKLVRRYELQTLPIVDEYRLKAKKVLDLLGISNFRADGEAEALCSWMCNKGLVDAVLTEDSDVLAYGTSIFIHKLDAATHTVMVIVLKDLLDALSMNAIEFRDLCILLECDYNSRIKGFPPDGKNHKKASCIGPNKALIIMNEYRSLDVAFEKGALVDPENKLAYKRCRKLFSTPAEIKYDAIPYDYEIDINGLREFLKENSCNFKLDRLLEPFKPIEMIERK